jgi:2-oxo-4-hydroxy-4-carboxy-5-ureidoimidazoline decarboxylase
MTLSKNVPISLAQLNALPEAPAKIWFSHACAASTWINAMAQQRPYAGLDALLDQAVKVWQHCQSADYLEAFEAHPMIGDINSLREKFAGTRGLASHEQSGANHASEQTLIELSQLNHQYRQQNGFIFIICATGLSANSMLEALQIRIKNNPETELMNAAAEQIKISLLRLDKGIEKGLNPSLKTN